MEKKVGIPRGLFYYQFFPLWKTFFDELGVEYILSDATTKKILDDGVKACVDEACLPVKLFHGHVLNLKGRVDYLFIPRYTSISRDEYICPKIGGLPDMVRNSLEGLPEIINTEINIRRSEDSFMEAAQEIGAYFGRDKARIRKAFGKAAGVYGEFLKRAENGEFPGDFLEGRERAKAHRPGDKRLNIVVIGHPYNLYDPFINMGLVEKLRKFNANVIAIENIKEEKINEKAGQLSKKMFWNFGRKAVGTAMHIAGRKDIDGIIYLMSFGCGVDSFACDMAERRVRSMGNIPFIILTLDEHSGEAGLNTRLEAFTDMVRWRKKNEDHIPAHG